MATTTTVTIATRYARGAVSFALWRIIAVDVVGERALSESVYSRAWREIHAVYADGESGEAEFRLLRVAAVGAAARAVAASGDGARIELPVAPEELADALDDCVRAIDQSVELFTSLPADEREEVIRCRRAALRMLGLLRGQPHSGPLGAHDGMAVHAVPAFAGLVRAKRLTRPVQPDRSDARSVDLVDAPAVR